MAEPNRGDVLDCVFWQENAHLPPEEDAHGTGPGRFLRGRRHMAGLTQGEAAARLGISRSMLSAYENGRRPIPRSFVEKLVATFDVDGVEFVFRHRRTD